MGLVIERRTELCGPVSQRVVDASNDLLALINQGTETKSHSLLSFLDPYIDTAFNGRQLQQLRDELDELIKPLDVAPEAVIKIRDLVINAIGQIHEYVVFMGD
jgi:hypothetical protein